MAEVAQRVIIHLYEALEAEALGATIDLTPLGCCVVSKRQKGEYRLVLPVYGRGKSIVIVFFTTPNTEDYVSCLFLEDKKRYTLTAEQEEVLEDVFTWLCLEGRTS